MKKLFPLVFLLLCLSVKAAELEGVRLDEQTSVAGSEVALLGAGLRTRLFFKVYVIGLYVGNLKADPLAQPGPKRVQIRMLRDVDAATFTEALAAGIKANASEAEAIALEPRVKQLSAIMAEVKEAKKGMRIALDWTGRQTQVVIDGKPAGGPIEGEDFYRALLRIWLGEKPVQDDLKKALLGAK